MFGNDNSKPLLLPIVYDLANLIREGFLRSDKHKEHEKQNHHQFLRRSFHAHPQTINTTATTVVKEIDFSAPVSYFRDEPLMVEDSEPVVKNIEKMEDIKSEPLMQVLNKSLQVRNQNYSIPATLTRAHLSTTTVKSKFENNNLTMEEFENLALSGLNGTFDIEESIKDVNGSEISPMALIGRRRKKPSHQQRFKPGPIPETCERFTGT